MPKFSERPRIQQAMEKYHRERAMLKDEQIVDPKPFRDLMKRAGFTEMPDQATGMTITFKNPRNGIVVTVNGIGDWTMRGGTLDFPETGHGLRELSSSLETR